MQLFEKERECYRHITSNIPMFPGYSIDFLLSQQMQTPIAITAINKFVWVLTSQQSPGLCLITSPWSCWSLLWPITYWSCQGQYHPVIPSWWIGVENALNNGLGWIACSAYQLVNRHRYSVALSNFSGAVHWGGIVSSAFCLAPLTLTCLEPNIHFLKLFDIDVALSAAISVLIFTLTERTIFMNC
jgi:hypothetical protein